jgi:hypothetical protein
LRRSSSLAQLSGKYNRHAIGTVPVALPTDRLTAT